MSQEHLKSIKSRMGWQVGLQTATLLAVGSVNNQIKEQTDIIGEKLVSLNDNTIEGFNNVTEAINSLEASLMTGLEDIKWFLGSIDDKLGKIIGLIEYSRATQSTEQFKIGMELYKQEYYDKALKHFEESIDKNPLNLNAKAGLYLVKKQLKTKREIKILLDLVKLTDSDFLYHTKATSDIKETKTNYFINFCFGELLENKSYNEIITLYDNEVPSFSKEHLPIKLKYINAVVLSGGIYNSFLEQVLREGQLEKLMMFFKYEKGNKHLVKFIEDVTDFIKLRLPKSESYNFQKAPSTLIEKKAIYFKEVFFKSSGMIMKLGFFETSLSSKIKAIKTFLETAQFSSETRNNIENLMETASKNLEITNSIENPKFFKTSNTYLTKALNQIIKSTNDNIQAYKEKTSNELSNELKSLKRAFEEFSTGYPLLEQNSKESHEIVNAFIDNIDISKKIISLENIFNKEYSKS